MGSHQAAARRAGIVARKSAPARSSDNVVVVERAGVYGVSAAPVPTGVRGGRYGRKSSGLSLDHPVVKYGVPAAIVLIGSGLLMKTYRKYFPADSAVAGVIDATSDTGDAVSDVVGDVSHEVGETVATVPYEFAHGVYGVARIAAADVWRAFIASGASAYEAGVRTQEWIDSQVSGAANAAVSPFVDVYDWLSGGSDPVDPATDEPFFGGGSPDPDAGFGGGWDADDGLSAGVIPGSESQYADYLEYLASGAALPALGLGALQDIYLDVYGDLPEGVAYAGSRGYAGCEPDCHYVGRGLNASLVCARTCPDASVYASFLADQLSVVGGFDFPPAPSGLPPVSSGDGSGNAGSVPSSGPGMPDYS